MTSDGGLARLKAWFTRVFPGNRLIELVTASVDEEERRLLFVAVVVGTAVWACAFSLERLVHLGFELLVSLVDRGPSVAVIFVPLGVGALGVAALVTTSRAVVHYRAGNGELHELNAVEGDGLERAISLYFSSEPTPEQALLGRQGVEGRWKLPTFSLAARKWLATIVTLVTGGSGGLEASVSLVGESIAAGLLKPRALPRWLPRGGTLARAWQWWSANDHEDLQAAQLCGIAAAVSTLLGTPFAGAFFAIEVMYRRTPIVDRLIYALVSALVAFFLSHVVTGDASGFGAPLTVKPPIYEGRYYVALLAVAITIVVVAGIFRRARGYADDAFHHITSPWRRHVLGAAMTGAIAVTVGVAVSRINVGSIGGLEAHPAAGVELVLGTGKWVIDAAIAGNLGALAAAVLLGARLVATLSTISSGGSAGLLYPTLCFGSLSAIVWSKVFGYPAAILVVPAMTASLVSIVNVPLAAVLLVVEGFGVRFVAPALFMLVAATILAHKTSIYRPQRERFDDRQILPGVGVRRVRVPATWAGSDLRRLAVRQRFGLTVIGLIDRQSDGDAYDERIVLNPSPDQPIGGGDVLIVLGQSERLDAFEAELRAAQHGAEGAADPAAAASTVRNATGPQRSA